MKHYILNINVGDFEKGNTVTEAEISQLLNIKQCVQCGWLTPVDNLTGLMIDASKGTSIEVQELSRLWKKFQPKVINVPHKIPLPGDYFPFTKLSIMFGNGKKLSVDELIKQFQNQPLQFCSQHETIGTGWVINSFEIKNSKSSFELIQGIYKRKTDGLFYKDDISMPARWFIVNKAEIHSVERLRDHSVFSVSEETNYGTIERIIRSWVGIEIHFTNGSGATLESLEKISDCIVKEMTAHNLSSDGTKIIATVKSDVTNENLKKIKTAIEGILSKVKK